MVVCAFSLHAVLKPEASFSFFYLGRLQNVNGNVKGERVI
jgi:hypothetical protein